MNTSAAAPLPDLGSVDLNLFRVFLAVYQLENLTHAAAKLHLTQPAVSNALSRLRRELNDPLFVRDGRRMVATPRARQLAPAVQSALSALSGALRPAAPRFQPQQETRRFVLGMRESPELAVLPRFAELLSRQAPHVSIHSVRFERRRLSQLLRASALDLAIDIHLPVPDDIRVEPLFMDELCLAVRRRHPLRGQLGSLEGWLGLRHVVVSARPRGPLLEDPVLTQLGIQRDVAVRCQHYYAACQLIARSDFALLVPRRFAQHVHQRLGLSLLPCPVPLPQLAVALYWHRSAERDEGLSWLLSCLRRERESLVNS